MQFSCNSLHEEYWKVKKNKNIYELCFFVCFKSIIIHLLVFGLKLLEQFVDKYVHINICCHKATLHCIITPFSTLSESILLYADPHVFINSFRNSEPALGAAQACASLDISNSSQIGRVLYQYADQLWASAWQCALLQTEGALW